MADKRTDSAWHNSKTAKTLRAIDASGRALSDYWQHLTLHRGARGAIGVSLALGVSSLALGTATSIATYEPDPNVKPISIDADISGKGLLNRAYGYEKHGNSAYLLIHDEGRYQLYEWSAARERNEFIADFDIAKDIIGEISAAYTSSLETIDWNRSGDFNSEMYACSTIKDPVVDDGEIVRYEANCPVVKGDLDALKIHYERAEGFWSEAGESMTTDNYGHEDGLPKLVKPENNETSLSNSLNYAVDYGLAGLSGWLLLAGFGTGVSSLRRREEKHTQPKPRR